MMLNRSLKVAALLLVGAAGTANAAGAWNSGGSVCGGGLFITCASVTVSWTGNVVTLTGVNLGPGSWKAIALANLGAYTGTVTQTSGPANFSLGANDLSNFPNAQVASGANQGNQRLDPGPTVHTWVFTFNDYGAGGVDALDGIMANAQVAVHAIDGPNGCSSKMAIRNDGSTYGTDQLDPLCATTTVAPEPAAMVLLATGLLGMSGVSLLRRRQNRRS